MNLGNLWDWDKRKLGCRIRVETHNPALDELRERLRDLPDLIRSDDVPSRPESERSRFNGPAASRATMLAACARECQRNSSPEHISKTRKNIYKKFFQIPRSPPSKIVIDLQKDRLHSHHKMCESSSMNMRNKSQISRRKHNRSRPVEIETSDKHVIVKKVEEETTDSKEHVLPPYGGDLFMTRGVYMSGIIYQSRLSSNVGNETRQHGLERRPVLQQEHTANSSVIKYHEEHATSEPTRARQPHTAQGAQEAKLHCANSLAAWSIHSENAVRLAEEGAVPAALVLSKDENVNVRKACAGALRRMSQHKELCEQLVMHNAVPVISELGMSTNDAAVACDCGSALVNLTIMDGIEAKLVEDGIVVSFLSLMNQREDLAELCSCGLFNLTCVDHPYMYMERVIKAFVSLASSPLGVVKHICAAALCNLSDVKPIRSRIVEEGVVQVVGLLARGAEARTRRVCAIVLHSLASSRNCRADMVSKGTVQVLYALSSDVDTITLHYIASAIIRLAMDQQNLPRLVHEGGVTALCNICLRCPREIATTQLCASALCLLSQRAIGRHAIVQEGCVPALVSLLHEASDLASLRHGLSALTNLLVDEANHEQVLGQGGIAAVIVLSNHSSSEIREACALALFNFSRGSAAHERGVSASAIPAIIALSRLPEPRTRMRCAATLCKLAAVEANVSLMVNEGVVPAFIDMLQTRDKDIVKHCCAALCRLAHEGSSAVTIAKGAVPHVIAGCAEGSDAATRQSCCAVLSAVSAHEHCREPLCSMGTLQALITLARGRGADNITRLRCAVAFANLSHEPTVQGEMVSSGIVPVIEALSNSYCEENQLYCAQALCNLSCHSGSEEAIVEQGGVAALMMICMVRAVSSFTKQICARALLNLLCAPAVNQNWLPYLAKEGLVQAVAVLSRLLEEEAMYVCASIFCILSAQGPVGRSLLTQRRSTLKDLFNLMRSNNQDTKIACGKAACNLLGHHDSKMSAIQAGAIHVLSSLCNLGDPEMEVAAADAFFVISEDVTCRKGMIEANVLPMLINNARSPRLATCQSCLRAIAHLAWWGHVRAHLLRSNIMCTLVDLVERTDGASSEDSMVGDLILYILTYITFIPDELKFHLAQADVIPALNIMYRRLNLSENAAFSLRVRMFVAGSLRSLAAAKDVVESIVKHGAIGLIGDIMCADDRITSEHAAKADIVEHCTSALYSIAQTRLFHEEFLAQGALKAILMLDKYPACFAMAAAILHLVSLEPEYREVIALDSAARSFLLHLADAQGDPNSVSTLHSCAQTFFWLSRCTMQSREELTSAGLIPMLIRLSRHSDDRVASACSEALKNLSSGESSGIEEGTVSTLISMTLSGGSANLVTDDAVLLVDIPVKPLVEDNYRPAENILPGSLRYKTYVVSVTKARGGIAGTGPPPPLPPETDVQDTLSLPFFENTDAIDDDEHMGTSMMFAKMTADMSPN